MASNNRSPKRLSERDRPAEPLDREVRWGSDVAAQMLRKFDIPYVALNPGASYRGLHDSLVNHLGNEKPEMLMCLHEEHAVAIAQGYAKATGKPMAVVLHANVGLMHGSMAIFNAFCDRQPMMILGATGPVDAALRRPWIDWLHTAQDQGALIRNFTKWDDQPSSMHAIPESMLRAWQMTRSAPSAPVYICLDAAVQEQEVESPVRIPELSRYEASAPPRANADSLDAVVDALKSAQKPVILFGRCARTQEAWNQRVELAERLGARMMSDLKAGTMVPSNHPLHVDVPFNGLSKPAKKELLDSDVILSLGWIDLDGILRQGYGEDPVTAKVIHAGLDQHLHNGWGKEHLGLPATDINMLCSPDTLVTDLLDKLSAEKPKTSHRYNNDKPVMPDSNDSLNIRHIAVALRKSVGTETPVTFPALARSWPADLWPHTHPLEYLGKDGGGGIGSGPGISIGAALALRDNDNLVVSVLGDGDTTMSINALWTAGKYQIPLLMIIANNRSYFNDELHQEGVAKIRDRNPANRWVGQQVDNPAPDIAKLAEAQGVHGIGPVTTVDALQSAMDEAVALVKSGKPCVLDVHIDPEHGRHVRESGAQRSMAKGV